MKKIYPYILLLACLIINSCSSDYDYSSNINLDEIAFITLKTSNANKRVFGNEETVSFQLINDLNQEDISNGATFSIDGESILGNQYSFQETGLHTVQASINGIQSNSIEINIVDGNYIFIEENKALRGQEVLFKSFRANGSEITSESTFIVNNTSLTGNTFQTNETGTYEVISQYQGDTSNPESFTVFAPKRKVALEDYTGDWCGWCPRVLLVVDEVTAITDDVVVLAIHKNDDMEFSQADDLIESFNVGSSLPKLRANRTENINVIQDAQIPNAVQNIVSQAGTEVSSAIAINTKLSNNILNVEVNLLSEDNLPSNYKLAVYLYQDGMIFPQTNYYNTIEGSEWYQAGDPIEDFVHNHVLEASLTNNILGDEIGSTSAYQVSSKSFNNINLASYEYSQNDYTFDPTHFGVAVFLVDENNNAITAQSVKAGQNVDFDE